MPLVKCIYKCFIRVFEVFYMVCLCHIMYTSIIINIFKVIHFMKIWSIDPMETVYFVHLKWGHVVN